MRWPGAAVAAASALACASYPRAPIASSIDAEYQWGRAQDGAAPQPGNTAVALYRSALRATVSGHCTLLPSESTLAQWRFGRCGIPTAVTASMARWYLEPDAAYLGLPVVGRGDRLYFAQLPPTCWPLER